MNEKPIVYAKVALIALQCLEIMRAFPDSDAAVRASKLIKQIHEDKFGKARDDRL